MSITAATGFADSNQVAVQNSPYDNIDLNDYEKLPWFKRFRKFVCKRRVNSTLRKLVECVTVDEVRKHQKKFQDIADENGDIRASGTPGYDRSVDYVIFKMRRAGYEVTRQPFEFTSYIQTGPSTLEQLAPNAVTYTEDVDYTLMSQTKAGDVMGNVTPVDLDLGPGNASSSGCEPEDFTDFQAGHIALVQRGHVLLHKKLKTPVQQALWVRLSLIGVMPMTD